MIAYIIDRYSPFNQWDREHEVFVFEANKVRYAVMWVELEWGLPVLQVRPDTNTNPAIYKVYGTKEEAMAFARQIKSLN